MQGFGVSTRVYVVIDPWSKKQYDVLLSLEKGWYILFLTRKIHVHVSRNICGYFCKYDVRKTAYTNNVWEMRHFNHAYYPSLLHIKARWNALTTLGGGEAVARGLKLGRSTGWSWAGWIVEYTRDPLPETKPASLHLKIDSWNTIVSFWDGLFSVANC